MNYINRHIAQPIRHALNRGKSALLKIYYWRDHSGPEVDYVLEQNQTLTPIEVKWCERPVEKDYRHVQLFLDEYKNSSQGYVICQTPKRFLLTENITAIPWHEIETLFCGTSS